MNALCWLPALVATAKMYLADFKSIFLRNFLTEPGAIARWIGNIKPTVSALVSIISLFKRLTMGINFVSGILFCNSLATCSELPVPEK